jgi:hypothetical protein
MEFSWRIWLMLEKLKPSKPNIERMESKVFKIFEAQ